MKPIHTSQNTIFAIRISAVGMSACRSMSLAPSRERSDRSGATPAAAGTAPRPEGDEETAGEDDGGGDQPRHEQHEGRGEVAPGLDERIGDFLNHRDLTPRPTSGRPAQVSAAGRFHRERRVAPDRVARISVGGVRHERRGTPHVERHEHVGEMFDARRPAACRRRRTHRRSGPTAHRRAGSSRPSCHR